MFEIGDMVKCVYPPSTPSEELVRNDEKGGGSGFIHGLTFKIRRISTHSKSGEQICFGGRGGNGVYSTYLKHLNTEWDEEEN